MAPRRPDLRGNSSSKGAGRRGNRRTGRRESHADGPSLSWSPARGRQTRAAGRSRTNVGRTLRRAREAHRRPRHPHLTGRHRHTRAHLTPGQARSSNSPSTARNGGSGVDSAHLKPRPPFASSPQSSAHRQSGGRCAGVTLRRFERDHHLRRPEAVFPLPLRFPYYRGRKRGTITRCANP